LEKVSFGSYHLLALQSDSTLWAWGADNFGQLGDGDMNPLFNINGMIQIGTQKWRNCSAGGAHSAAILAADSSLWTWGYNTSGQLGTGYKDQKIPQLK